MEDLREKKTAVLTENGFEELELTSPKEALESAGAKVFIVSPQPDMVRGWRADNWSIAIPVDLMVGEANPDDFDALLIPGGVINPDKMRRNKACVGFAKAFLESGKPLFAICHGPQLLIETGLLRGRTMTSFYSIKTDLINAGVIWQDKEVVTDNGLVTSRSPEDLPAFNKKIIEELMEGVHPPVRTFGTNRFI
jgi:protease I